MTSKQRMLIALGGGRPDRLPITIHQWQPYHLEHFMDGMDQLEAYQATGLDASVTVAPCAPEKTPDWIVSSTDEGAKDGQHLTRFRIATPDGDLTWLQAANEYTSFRVTYPIHNQAEAEMLLKYLPRLILDKKEVARWYNRTGDAGIVRGFIFAFGQAGCWQDFCEMAGTEAAILWAMDDPQWLHDFFKRLCDRKVTYIHEELAGAKYDLIETGGGAGSSTVISPAMFDEFCVPYDRRINDALREVGLKSVYHTCGGMMAILDRIPNNHTDASETLSPTGVGGDIEPRDRMHVKRILGGKVSLIGGIDQGRLLTEGTPEEIRADIHHLFQTFGVGGGYIASASDHFFHTPVENLKVMARAAKECRY